MTQIKTSDVTKFLKDLVEMTMVYAVDEDGYVISKKTEKRITRTENDVASELLIYQENITDSAALVINPLSEGQSGTPSALWLYEALGVSLMGRMYVAARTIIAAAIEEKKAKADTKDKYLSIEILNHAAKIIEMVDPNMLAEIDKLSEDRVNNEFLRIYYQRTQLRSVLRSGVFEIKAPKSDPNRVLVWKDKYPKIRDKTWECLEVLMLSILGLTEKEDISKFTKKATVLSCARLSSFLNLLMAVYQEINPLLAAIDNSMAVDLSQFAHHINHLEDYSNNAKWWRQPTRAVPQTVQATPEVPGVVSAGIPPVPAAGPAPVQVDLIPGPVYADGRPSPPIPVIHSTQYYPVQSDIPAMPQPGGLPGSYQPQYGMQPGYPPMGYPQPNYYPQQQPIYPQQGQYVPAHQVPPNMPFDGPYKVYTPQPQPQYGGGFVQFPGGPVLNRYA